ncbi:tetratricopeptide repeat protein [Dankookia sp. GCM10030260]|uniref:tetratricopeptide repeat protein n=1 Tax=Dankookia sp. GCM10030260 TaxID=3273390 RepID=UPI0036211CCA
MARGIARWEGPPRAATATEACAGCHAHRREIVADPAPGAPFLGAYTPALLEPELYQPDGAILGEVFEWGSFQQSAMHRAGVTRTDCHEPHSARLRAAGNALCLQCHAAERFEAAAHHRHAAGSAGAQCTACHLATRTYMGVHRQHDHAFRVPRPDVSAVLGTSDACTDCHADHDAPWAAAGIAEWHGEARRREPHWGSALAAGRAGAPGAAAQLLALAGDCNAPCLARATALSLLGGLPPARGSPATRGAAALGVASRDPDPLVHLGAATAAATLPPADRAAILASLVADPLRAVRLEAARALAPVLDAALPPEHRAAWALAMAEYQVAARHNADQPEALGSLGDVLAEQGRAGEAEARYRAALRLDAGFVPARTGLSELLRRTGREREAEAVLREGIAQDVVPGAAALHHSLGLSLVRQRRGAEALEALAEAARLGPSDARFAFVHAVALDGAGRPREASEAVRAALLRHPGNRDILLMLASIARDGRCTGHRPCLCAAGPGRPSGRPGRVGAPPVAIGRAIGRLVTPRPSMVAKSRTCRKQIAFRDHPKPRQTYDPPRQAGTPVPDAVLPRSHRCRPLLFGLMTSLPPD